ncbi:MAG: hypothetical protein ACREXP_09715 [Steroidobacteraceae bacterium]
MDEAVANHAVLGNQLWRDGIEDAGEAGAQIRRAVGASIEATKLREFNTLGVVLGYRYDDSPVILSDGTRRSPPDFLNYVPSAHPGCLAPHAWLHDGTSLYDHFGPGFTLLATEAAAAADIDRACWDFAVAGIPLHVLRPREPAIADLYQARYALIRPDQHVAWRGNEWPGRTAQLPHRVAGCELPG